MFLPNLKNSSSLYSSDFVMVENAKQMNTSVIWRLLICHKPTHRALIVEDFLNRFSNRNPPAAPLEKPVKRQRKVANDMGNGSKAAELMIGELRKMKYVLADCIRLIWTLGAGDTTLTEQISYNSEWAIYSLCCHVCLGSTAVLSGKPYNFSNHDTAPSLSST